MLNIAINGFGRIGRTFLRTIMQDEDALKKISVKVINIGPAKIETVALLFKRDSVMGTFPGEVQLENNTLMINNHCIKVIAECDPACIPWKDYGITWVVEATGRFTKRAQTMLHLQSGAKKVLITAPATDEDVSVIPGVNDEAYAPDKHHIVALGSCTTNCFAPIVKVLKENFTFQNGIMTTVHAYTNNQVLLDLEHKDPRRARAAAINIVPTGTGADKVITKIYPDLEGKVRARALRIPVPIVSIIDFTFSTEETLSIEAINKAFHQAAHGKLKGIIEYTAEPLVSSDYQGNPASCIFDSSLTECLGNLGKVFGWYDNEWGYSERLKDFLLHNS